MNQVINQVRRIFSDDGRGDKDFTEQERRLDEARKKLTEATQALKRAAELLHDTIKSMEPVAKDDMH